MTYYLFNINPIFKIISNDYELFAFLKNIYLSKNSSLKKEIDYNNIVIKINQKEIDNRIREQFINQKAYQYHQLLHCYDNRYTDENFTLRIGKTLLFLRSNHFNKELFSSLKTYSLFVCDFNNQNYFWTDELGC